MIRRYDKNWPKCFPDGCPPENASEKDTKIYRLCYKKEGPDFYDFLCDYVVPEKAHLFYSNEAAESVIIDGHGISVFDDYEAALSMWSSRHMRNRYSSIACGEGINGFSKQDGKNKNHRIWWAYADVNPMTHFKLVNKGDNNEV